MMFSIIMPAYNAEQFLAKSIQSVVQQTYSDWELILINDGSKDNTELIARDYFGRESRIQYYSQENTGVSASRNRGIELAKGDYILFVDADDEIDLNALQRLDEILRSKPYDVVVFNTYRCDMDSNVIGKVTVPFSQKALELSHDLEKKCVYSALASDRIFGIIGNFAVKSELVANIRFRTDMIMYEDLLFDIQMYKNAESIICLPDYFYYYRDNLYGSVRKFHYQKFKDLQIAYEAKMTLAKEKSLQGNEKNINRWFCLTILSNYMSILENKKQAKEYVDYVRENEYILAQFSRLQDVPPKKPSVKLMTGNAAIRAMLRNYYLLRRKMKKLLHR